MPTLPRPTYGSPVTPRNPVNICRLSEELIPVRFRRVNPAASLKHIRIEPCSHVAVHGFRRVNPAASLKRAQEAVQRGVSLLGFRRVNPAASLKPASFGTSPHTRRRVSAG